MELRDELRAASTLSTDTELSVESNRAHEIITDCKMIECTITARQLIDIYSHYRSAVFRLNVRGPLGATKKANREIANTLQDDSLKKDFHLVNNGLTAVCDGYSYDGAKLVVKDLQIVNGCQTTWTLWRNQDRVTDDVLVNLRLIESQNFSEMISHSTNSQSSMKAEDFMSIRPEHDILVQKFARLKPPWLYEKARGLSGHLRPGQARRQKQVYGDRSFLMKDLGQSALAFFGRPTQAKWNTKVLWDSGNELGDEIYKTVFVDKRAPEQLLIPLLVWRGVDHHISEKAKSLPSGDGRRDWLSYSKAHVAAIVGELLRQQSAPVDGFLSAKDSKEKLASIDDWLPELANNAVDAVKYTIDVYCKANKRPALPKVREYFRRQDEFEEMIERAVEVANED